MDLPQGVQNLDGLSMNFWLSCSQIELLIQIGLKQDNCTGVSQHIDMLRDSRVSMVKVAVLLALIIVIVAAFCQMLVTNEIHMDDLAKVWRSV